MSPITFDNGTIINQVTGYPLWTYKTDGTLLATLSGTGSQISHINEQIVGFKIRESGGYYTTKESLTVNPAEVVTVLFRDIDLTLLIQRVDGRSESYTLSAPGQSHIPQSIPEDRFFGKLLALAQYHVENETPKDEAKAHIAKMMMMTTSKNDIGIPRSPQVQPGLSEATSTAITKVNLTQDETASNDEQLLYKELNMLLSFINARIQSDMSKANPGGIDITTTKGRINATNQLAYWTFQYYNTRLGQYATSKTMSQNDMNNTYSSRTVNLEFVKDLFKGFQFSESALLELGSVVDNFTKSMSNATSSSDAKGLHTTHVVICNSLVHPNNNPNLEKEGILRLFYIQFVEDTQTWSNLCSKGERFNLAVNVFSLDVGINRTLCHLMYPTLLNKSVEALGLDANTVESISNATDATVQGGPLPPPLN